MLQVVGVHDGYWFYTVGQRGGIKLPGGPWYVTRKDMSSNVVYVSRTYYEQERRRDAFACGPFNWLGPARPQPGRPLSVKVRHGPHMYECSLRLGGREEVAGVLEQGTGATFQQAAAGDQQGVAAEAQQRAPPADSSSSSGGGGGDGVEEYGVVLLSENDQGLAAGQYAVFYQDQQCLGSAQIVGGLARTAAA
jgi:tRNA-specific 2-thiouridylase